MGREVAERSPSVALHAPNQRHLKHVIGTVIEHTRRKFYAHFYHGRAVLPESNLLSKSTSRRLRRSLKMV